MQKQKGVVLGLGEFGYYLVRTLAMSEVELIVIDKDEMRINKVKDLVENAIIADVMADEDLSSLIPQNENYDFVIISLGNLEASLLTTLYFKEKHIKNLYVKAINDKHLKILKKLKIENILFPQRDSAERLGKTLSFKSLLEYIPLSKNYRLIEVKAINKILNKTLQELHFRKTYKLSIIAIKNENGYNFDLTAQTKIKKGDILLVIGRDEYIEKYNKLADKEKKKFSPLRQASF